jgi:hypothetical protein
MCTQICSMIISFPTISLSSLLSLSLLGHLLGVCNVAASQHVSWSRNCNLQCRHLIANCQKVALTSRRVMCTLHSQYCNSRLRTSDPCRNPLCMFRRRVSDHVVLMMRKPFSHPQIYFVASHVKFKIVVCLEYKPKEFDLEHLLLFQL